MKNAVQGDFVDFAWRGILKKGRDNARTPMQWNDSLYAGFSDVLPWINVNTNFKTINVEQAMRDSNSILHFYKRLIELKSTSLTLIYGDFEPLFVDNDSFFVYKRSYKLEQIVVICNMTKEIKFLEYPDEWRSHSMILSNTFNDGNQFQPYEVRVLMINSNHA
jgi:glycosidase